MRYKNIEIIADITEKFKGDYMENNKLKQFARQLYLDGLLNLSLVRKFIKAYEAINDTDKEYFELLGHVTDTVNVARLTKAKSRRAELKTFRQRVLQEKMNMVR